MSNPSVVVLQLPASVSNGIALSQTPTGAGPLTLAGSLVTAGVANLATAQRVGIASGGNDASVVFTVTGTDRYGNTQTSTVTGLNVSMVYTALDFLTVTSISSSAGTAGAITAGTVGVGSSPWVLDNYLATVWALQVGVSIVSGSGTYTVEHTYDDPNAQPPSLTISPQQFSLEAQSYFPPLAWPDQVLTGQTRNGETNFEGRPIMAHRLTITAGTGQLVMQSIQAGIT